jgi:hypothetical protein
MEVSGHLHYLDTSSIGKEPQHLLDRRLVWTLRIREKSVSTRNNQNSLVFQPVALSIHSLSYPVSEKEMGG